MCYGVLQGFCFLIIFPSFVDTLTSLAPFCHSFYFLSFFFSIGFYEAYGLTSQVHKFSPPNFCCPSNNIKVLNIPFGFVFFISFLQDVLDKDGCHVDALLKLKDVQVTFGIFFDVSLKNFPTCFILPPPINLLTSICLFQCNLHLSFRETHGSKLLDCP